MENPVERAVNEATADTLQMPDQKLMKQVADLVNQRADQSKFAVQAIGKRLMQLRNGKVQALTMELIEYLAFTCETPFYTQIATNDFLQRLNTLLNPQMNAQMQQRLLQVIAVLKQLMQSHQDLFPAFFQFLQKISLKHQVPNNYDSKYAVLRKAQPVYSSGARVNSLGSGNSKNDKLRRDLEIVKSNISLTNEIIDNANPQEDASKNEILKDMTTTLRGVEEKLRNLITDMGNNDEGLMSFCLELNDDLLRTFTRYETLKKHKKPDPFRPEQQQQQQQQQQQPQQPFTQPQNVQPSPFQQSQNPFSIPPPMQQPTQTQSIQQPPQIKPQQIDLLNLFEYDEPKPVVQQQKGPQLTQAVQPEKQQQNIIDLFEVDMPNPQPQQQQQLSSMIPQSQIPPISQLPPNSQLPPVSQVPPMQQIPSLQQTPTLQQYGQPPVQSQLYGQAPVQSQLYGQPPTTSQIPFQSNYSAMNAFPPQQQVPIQQQQFVNQQQNLQQLYQPQQFGQTQNKYQAFQQQPTQPYQQNQPYQQQGFSQQQYPVISNVSTQQKKPENEFDNILNLAVGQKSQPQQQTQKQQQQQQLDFI